MSKPNKGKQILQSMKQPVKDSVDAVVEIISRVLKTFAYLRIFITVFLIGWLLTNSYSLIFKTGDDDLEPARIYYTHQLWFGDQSIVQMLSGMWYYAIFFIALGPHLAKITKVLKLYLIGQI